MVKNLPAMQEAPFRSLGQEYPLEKEIEPTPVFLPGEFYGQRSLAGYSLRGSQRVGHDWTIEHTDYNESKFQANFCHIYKYSCASHKNSEIT